MERHASWDKYPDVIVISFAITDTGEAALSFILQRPMVGTVSKPTDNKELQEEFTHCFINKKKNKPEKDCFSWFCLFK